MKKITETYKTLETLSSVNQYQYLLLNIKSTTKKKDYDAIENKEKATHTRHSSNEKLILCDSAVCCVLFSFLLNCILNSNEL